MAEQTGIEWTHHTWSPWWGCTKVSDGCKNCYADTLSNRWGFKIWGPNADRRFFGDKHWNDPIRWNRAAEAAGERRRVFPSMCDPFERRQDLEEPRARMFDLIDKTPWLDWLLVTKRPENIDPMWPMCWKKPKRNIWLLTSVEDQATADVRIPALLKCAAMGSILGLSMEPLLGPVDLTRFAAHSMVPRAIPLDWIIVGGESGHGARPMQPAWVRRLRAQAIAAGIPFFFKQWGEFVPAYMKARGLVGENGECYSLFDAHDNFNADEFCVRVGKKEAGRSLEGRTWDEFPETAVRAC